jgi:hypothetical protein
VGGKTRGLRSFVASACALRAWLTGAPQDDIVLFTRLMQRLALVVMVASRTLHERREGMRHPGGKRKQIPRSADFARDDNLFVEGRMNPKPYPGWGTWLLRGDLRRVSFLRMTWGFVRGSCKGLCWL